MGGRGESVRAARREGSPNLPSAKQQQGLDGVYGEVSYSRKDAQKFLCRVLGSLQNKQKPVIMLFIYVSSFLLKGTLSDFLIFK